MFFSVHTAPPNENTWRLDGCHFRLPQKRKIRKCSVLRGSQTVILQHHVTLRYFINLNQFHIEGTISLNYLWYRPVWSANVMALSPLFATSSTRLWLLVSCWECQAYLCLRRTAKTWLKCRHYLEEGGTSFIQMFTSNTDLHAGSRRSKGFFSVLGLNLLQDSESCVAWISPIVWHLNFSPPMPKMVVCRLLQ